MRVAIFTLAMTRITSALPYVAGLATPRARCYREKWWLFWESTKVHVK